MNSPNFSSILDKASSEVKFPKVPVGAYVGLVTGMPKYDKSARKQTPYVEFQIQLTEALEDVDADDLADYGPLGGKTLGLTFYYETEYGFKRLQAFLENCGIEDGGVSTRERIEQAPGSTIVVVVKHKISEDGRNVREEIDDTKPYGD